jgi:HAD superfamily hydrolase (TIGR01509 family)
MAQLKAVVFDSDGTLLNSFELIVTAYRHVAESHNLRVPSPEEVRAQLGKSLPDIFKAFYPDHDVEELLATNSAFIAANTMSSEAFEGVHEMLETLHEAGLKMAILTGGGHKITDMLKHHHIEQYFTSVVHHERVTMPKPHPEGFLLATRECGVNPNEAVMVGDSVADIRTGKDAGAFATIGVTHGYGAAKDLKEAGANYLLEGLPAVEHMILDLMSY